MLFLETDERHPGGGMYDTTSTIAGRGKKSILFGGTYGRKRIGANLKSEEKK
jgi:hypothetical protein